MSSIEKNGVAVESLMDGEISEEKSLLQPKLITTGSLQERIVFPTQKDTTGVLVIE